MKQEKSVVRTLAKVCSLTSLVALAAGCSGAPDPSEGEAVEGVLETVVVGNAERTASHFEYFLERADGVWIRLHFDERPDLLHGTDGHEHLMLPGVAGEHPAGVTLRATGSLDGDTLHVETLEVVAVDSGADGATSEALIAASPRKVAVILANFTANPSQPITTTGARDLVFAGATSSNAYFKEESFGIRSLVGKLGASGDVFGWYTLTASTATCDYSSWGNAARAMAQAAGVDLSGYDHIIHYFPRTSSCGWSGVGQVPGKYTWINGSSSQTIAHELGHNFGAHHSSSLSCTSNGTPVTISSTCTLGEYGNPFDVMGRGYRHMTAFNKGRTGFLEPENTVGVSADGTFNVTPLETKSTGIQSLRIPIDASNAYYVEFRQPFGFDNFSSTSAVVNGVLVTKGPLSYATIARPALLDMVPSTSSFTDAALRVGQTFTDTASGISVRLNSISPTAANVTVDVR
ncbi:MAG TPA: hypothetical protein VFZ53_20165 [Polyangiaceae bacterium]